MMNVVRGQDTAKNPKNTMIVLLIFDFIYLFVLRGMVRSADDHNDCLHLKKQ